MTNLEKETKSVGKILGEFFLLIGIGGIFLSLGMVGFYQWINHQPLTIPIALAAIAVVAGLALDGWAVFRFLKKRGEIYAQILKNEDEKID